MCYTHCFNITIYFSTDFSACSLIKSYLLANHDTSLSNVVPLEQLPSVDVLIKRISGQPSKGGLLTSLSQYDPGSNLLFSAFKSISKVLDGYHFPDDIFCHQTFMDNYSWVHALIQDMIWMVHQKFYVDQLQCSCDGCCAYVANCYYWNIHKCFSDAYLIDASHLVNGEQKYYKLYKKTCHL